MGTPLGPGWGQMGVGMRLGSWGAPKVAVALVQGPLMLLMPLLLLANGSPEDKWNCTGRATQRNGWLLSEPSPTLGSAAILPPAPATPRPPVSMPSIAVVVFV